MEKYTTVITNEKEITKSEFDELNHLKELDHFTPAQVKMAIVNIHGLIKKGETEELSNEEQDLVKSGTAELNNLTRYTINDMKNGRIVKADIYVQPKQVLWEDTLEKSATGGTIKKGVFLDTPLNRELDRVGDQIIKGKTIPKKKKDDGMSDEDRETMQSSDMYKACMEMVKKGEGSDSLIVMKSMTEKYPDMDKGLVKSYVNKVYKSVSEAYVEKAENYANMAEDEEEEDEENGKKKNGKKEKDKED